MPEEAKFCGYCGKPFVYEIRTKTKEKQKKKSSPKYNNLNNSKQVRPWVRLWARCIDNFLAGILLSVGVAYVYPEILKEAHSYIFTLLTLFLWVFLEPLFLASWGTTPGKWICRITLRKEGNKLKYGEALGRSLSVWILGLGIGIPLISFATQIVAYNKLKAEGKTTWDKEGNYEVTHGKVGFWRILIMSLLLIIYIILISHGEGIS